MPPRIVLFSGRTDDHEGAVRFSRHDSQAYASRKVLFGLAGKIDVAALARGAKIFARIGAHVVKHAAALGHIPSQGRPEGAHRPAR